MRNCLPSHEASRHTKGGPPDPFEASIVSDEGGQGWACGLFGRSGRYQGARFFRPVSSGPATLHPGRAGGAPGTFTQPRPDRILILRGVSAVFIGGTFLRPEYAQTVARC